METIVVKKTARNNATAFSINSKRIALVHTDSSNEGRYVANFGIYANGNNMTYTEAINYVSDNISRVLGEFGIKVTFE